MCDGISHLLVNSGCYYLYKLPHGQIAYSGHVVNLPQNVASFANFLPRLPSELDCQEGAANPHCDLRAVVLCALQSFTTSNVREFLAVLPEDGDLSVVSLDSTEENHQRHRMKKMIRTILSASFVTSTTQRMTEQETVRQQRQSRQQQVPPSTVSWGQ